MLEQMEAKQCFGEAGKNVELGNYFRQALEQLSSKYPKKIQGPFGCGMMVAFTPGDGSFEQAKALMTIMYEDGILGFVCGANPTRIRFLPPPVVTTKEHIDLAIQLLDRSLQQFSEA